MKKLLKQIVFIILLGICLLPCLIQAEAAGGEASFGSESYEWPMGEISPIKVYMNSDETITEMQMEIVYDPEMLDYSSGGELIQEGVVRVSGRGGNLEVSEMLHFVPKMGGSSSISVQEAYIRNGEQEPAKVPGVSVPVSTPVPEGCALAKIQVNGTEVGGATSEISSYSMEVEGDIEQVDITAETMDGSTQVEVSDTQLSVGTNTIHIVTTNVQGDKAKYTLNVIRKEVTVKESAPVSNEPTIMMEGDNRKALINRILFIILMVILAAALPLLIFIKIKMNKENKKNLETKLKEEAKAARIKHKLDNLEENEDFENIEEFNLLNEPEIDIAVRHITMEFKREKDEATSLKELIIKTVKRQRSYQMLKALDNVSFTVNKGEVLGIVGTNGSGKSTLFKLISGALKPTKGTIDVEQSKVQLLTLGTGFDYELTGRENVYLNGSIIGYSKEFIDKKYDEIVEFAELEGFMEEKVRNYSSGMVSRLAFAIATIQEAPGILILDEVLSVGDMFFRQKSEKRIKKLIKGGSTVLIVSHSPAVIRSNCTRAIWIEKGVLRATGTANEVCAAYERMNG